MRLIFRSARAASGFLLAGQCGRSTIGLGRPQRLRRAVSRWIRCLFVAGAMFGAAPASAGYLCHGNADGVGKWLPTCYEAALWVVTTNDPAGWVIWCPEPAGPHEYNYYIQCEVGTPRNSRWLAFVVPREFETSSEISVTGPSRTKALPGGWVLPQVATVLQNGAPAANKSVTIKLGGLGGLSSLSGQTDALGQFKFTYVPPYLRSTKDQITATCSDCSNTATKDVFVEACEVCE